MKNSRVKRQRGRRCRRTRCQCDAQGCSLSSWVCGEGRGPAQGRSGQGPGLQETQSSVWTHKARDVCEISRVATGRADSLSVSGAQYRPGLETQGEWGKLELKLTEAGGPGRWRVQRQRSKIELRGALSSPGRCRRDKGGPTKAPPGEWLSSYEGKDRGALRKASAEGGQPAASRVRGAGRRPQHVHSGPWRPGQGHLGLRGLCGLYFMRPGSPDVVRSSTARQVLYHGYFRDVRF